MNAAPQPLFPDPERFVALRRKARHGLLDHDGQRVTPELLEALQGGAVALSDKPLSEAALAWLQAVYLDLGRPCAVIQGGDPAPIADREWAAHLDAARPRLRPLYPSVGRVNVGPALAWTGTAWLVAPGVAVTNRHVADTFGGDPVVVDFSESGADNAGRAFAVLDVRSEADVDLAWLRLEARSVLGSGGPPAPIDLQVSAPAVGLRVAALGYLEPRAALTGQAGVKQLSLGTIDWVAEDRFAHDCTTRGGSSGSALVDLKTGRAVGVHLGGGAHGDANYAVPAVVLRDRARAQGVLLP